MLNKALLIIGLLSIAVILFLTDGCSLIGLGIGAAIDASKPDTVSVPGWRIVKIKPGTKINVLLNTGERMEGKYRGTEPIPPMEYAQRYSSFRENKRSELLLPALNSTITIQSKSGVQGEREILGFDYLRTIDEHDPNIMQSLGISAHAINVRTIGDTTAGQVMVANVEKIIDAEGNVVAGNDLITLSLTSQIPLLSELVLSDPPGKKLIPMDEVHQVEMRNEKNAKWEGLIFGGIVDAVVIIAIMSMDFTPDLSIPDTAGSCPLLYSFDGKDYILDSEAFGGSICKAFKRTDWSRLDHMTAVHDTCRLRITEELQETDYIDEIKLLVANHPKRTEIVPSFTGKLHTLNSPRAPLKAMDFDGNNVLNLVESPDESFWLSNPFGRNPEDRTDVRDGLILEFARPHTADFVKLVFNVKSTTWAALMQTRFLKLHGRELENWYQLLDSSAETRTLFQQVMIREGMTNIEIWNGREWLPSGYIWVAGTYNFRDQLLWLDLTKIPGDVLRVRLEATAGFVMVNSILADYSDDLPVETFEVSPSEARDYNGIDLRTVLETTDDHYHLMYTSDRADLTFIVPPIRKGYQRTYVLKSTGYYTVNLPAEGEPQTELIDRFINEPYAFGQYSLRLLGGYLTSALARLDHK
jgi:hypothetical protein